MTGRRRGRVVRARRRRAVFPRPPSPRAARLGLAAAGAAAMLVGAALGQVGQRAPEDEVFLGVVVRGSDLGAVFARQTEGGWLVPLDETLEILGAELREDGGARVIATPIGARRLPARALQDVDGVPHLRTEFLSEAMSTPVVFSDERYALDVDLPWTPGDPIREEVGVLDAAAAPPPPEPDATPPVIGFSRIFGELGAGYVSSTEDFELARLDLRIAGPAFGGFWQVRFEQALDAPMTFADPIVSDYIWVRPLSERVWGQIGNQRLTVGPLVGGVDVTGAQLAFSNRPDAFSFTGVSPGALLSSFGSGTRTFVGQGPAGGRAELWISDRRIAAVPIGIDGIYEIQDAPLFGLQTDVEIRIFRRLGDVSPIEIRQQTVTRGARFQPRGTLMALAGGGIEGNPLDPDDDAEGGLAFGRVMGAPFAWLTLGGSGIAFDDGYYVTGVDGVLELGPFASTSGSIAVDEDGVGAYEAGFSAQFGMAYVDALAFETRRGFNDRFSDDDEDDDDEEDDPFALLDPETLDRRAAVGVRVWENRADLGVEARQTEFAEFVLPYGSIVPMPGLSLSAMPDAYGDYRFEGDYVDGDGFSARALRVSDTSALRVSQDVETGSTGFGAVFGDAVYDDDGDWELSAGMSGERLGDHFVDWRAEAGAANGAPLAYLSFGRPIVEGVRGFVELSSFNDDISAFAGVSLDLAYADGRLRSGEDVPLDLRTGAVETVFVGRDGEPVALAPDERPRIDVDGAVPVYRREDERNAPQSSFLRTSVPRGLRRVVIQEGDLPIELSPQRLIWHAEVAPGTTTVLRVPLELRLGASGLVTTVTGVPAADALVTVVDAEGQEVARARANRFGQFRIDGLPPGRYRARAGAAETPFELTDDFLFGLALAGLPDPEASEDAEPLRVLDRVSAVVPGADPAARPAHAAAPPVAVPIGWTADRDAGPQPAAADAPLRVAEGAPVPGMPLPTPRPGPRPATPAEAPARLAEAPNADPQASTSSSVEPAVAADADVRSSTEDPVALAASEQSTPDVPDVSSTAAAAAPASLLEELSLGGLWTAATAPIRRALDPKERSAAPADGAGLNPPAGAASTSETSRRAPAPAFPVSELAPRRMAPPARRASDAAFAGLTAPRPPSG